MSAQAPLWGNLGLNRVAANSCPAPAREIGLRLDLTNRRTSEQLLEQTDRSLTLSANQSQQRSASWAVQSPAAQSGDWLDALLTATWQGHEIGLVTNQGSGERGPRLVVFVPGAPNPTAGRLVIIEASAVENVVMPVSDAMKFLLSVGKNGELR